MGAPNYNFNLWELYPQFMLRSKRWSQILWPSTTGQSRLAKRKRRKRELDSGRGGKLTIAPAHCPEREDDQGGTLWSINNSRGPEKMSPISGVDLQHSRKETSGSQKFHPVGFVFGSFRGSTGWERAAYLGLSFPFICVPVLALIEPAELKS